MEEETGQRRLLSVEGAEQSQLSQLVKNLDFFTRLRPKT